MSLRALTAAAFIAASASVAVAQPDPGAINSPGSLSPPTGNPVLQNPSASQPTPTFQPTPPPIAPRPTPPPLSPSFGGSSTCPPGSCGTPRIMTTP